MTEEQQGQPYDVVAGGSLEDGEYTFTAELGSARLVLSFPEDDEEAYALADILIQSMPMVVNKVAVVLNQQREGS